MRFSWLIVALGGALFPLGGCSSGQTGSPDCVPPVSCICDPLYGAGTLMRVHVERVQTDRLEAVVDEVFFTVYGATQVEAGDRVAGVVLAGQPCPSEDAASLQVGGELLVLYSPGSEQGAPRLLDGLFSWAVPWADTLSFGRSFQLSSSELTVLATPESCQERFPPEPPPPCHDTQTGIACSAAPPRQRGGGSDAAWLLGVTALAACVRRRVGL